MSLVGSSDAALVEQVEFPSGSYMLEGELAYPEQSVPWAVAVVAGPHPYLGGDMHNNVVRCLGDGLAQRGLATLRFNYRGVGRSEGPSVDVASHLAQFWETSHVPDELDLRLDVDAAVAFLGGLLGDNLPLVLAGYSFGCALLPLAEAGHRASAMVLVAPTVSRHDYQAYARVATPLLVIASEDDFATDAQELRSWFDRLSAPRQLIQAALDNHFFRGHEVWLVETACSFLRDPRR